MAGALVHDVHCLALSEPQSAANTVGSLNVGGNAKVQIGNTYIYNSQDESATKNCLAALRASTDPRDEILRIQITKGGLLKSVYDWILVHDDFQRWRDSDDVRILWVDGDAGKGKTMLLCGIVNELCQPQAISLSKQKDQSTSVSFFFCQATDYRLNGAAAVLRGLTYLLALQQPSLLPRVRDRYDHGGSQAFEGEKAYFGLSGLLAEMLQNYSGERCYMVVDALDECQDQLSHLIRFINDTASTCPAVKWLISSRNIPSIKRELRLDTIGARICLEANAEHIVKAVHTYIDHRVHELAPSADDEDLRDELRRQLRLKAGTTFLWVSIVTQELQNIPAFDFLEVLEEQPTGLDELYDAMLERVQNLPRPKYVDFCRLVISAVVTTYRPLHVLELAAMSGLPATIRRRIGSIKEIIDMCGSFLTLLEDRVYLIHQSVKDYLVTKNSPFIFPEGIHTVHLSLFTRSLGILDEVLRRDIYGLNHPGALITDVVRPRADPLLSAEYACIYWMKHLTDSILDDNCSSYEEHLSDSGSVAQFLEEHLMHWLEALSLLKGVSVAGQTVVALETFMKRLTGSTMSEALQDIRRTFQIYGKMIQERPLQVYASTLVFSPVCSVVRRWFEADAPKWLVSPKTVDMHWGPRVAELDHDSPITMFASSPDGRFVASACGKNVRVWDAASSHCFITLDAVDDLALLEFSPDSQLLASASTEGVVKVWDTMMWYLTASYSGPNKSPVDIKFSENGERVALAFGSHEVYSWHVIDGTRAKAVRPRVKDEVILITGLLQGNLEEISVCQGGVVQIWNQRGKSLNKTAIGQGYELSESSFAFSQTGRYLACWDTGYHSEVKELEVWDLKSGVCCGKLHMETDIDSAALSADGRRLAFSHSNTMIQIWDVATTSHLATYKTGFAPTKTLAFSSDGQQIIVHLESQALMILEIDSLRRPAFAEDEEQATAVVLSHDGKRAALSFKSTVTVRDDSTSWHTGKPRRISDIVFSPNDESMAIVCTNGLIEIWDVESGVCRNVFEGEDDWRGAVAMAHGNDRVAFCSGEGVVRVESFIDSATKLNLSLGGHGPLAFTKNGEHLATGYENKQIRIRDMTGEHFVDLLHTVKPCAVAFSQDDQLVATASEASSYTVYIWNITGQHITTIYLPNMAPGFLVGASYRPLNMSFEENDCCLRMDRNTLLLGPKEFLGVTSKTTSAELAGYGFSTDNEWITYKGDNVLWLPPDYRPWYWHTAPLSLVITNQAGRVFMFRLAEEKIARPF